MSEKELIETLKDFEEKRVEQLPENARNLFYAIMKIADERDMYKNIVKETRNWVKSTFDIIEQQPTGNDEWILKRLNSILGLLDKGEKRL